MADITVEELKFDKNGLLPVIAQDYMTSQVLMLAYMNAEAYQKTKETGKVHYFSRSRNQLWLKGETSGHYQLVKDIRIDCDGDSLLILVEQIGAACHTGKKTCFYRNGDGEVTEDLIPGDIFAEVYNVIVNRRNHPVEGSYTNYLFDKGIDKILKKVGEETAEVIIGAKNRDKSEITYEVADLIYHLSVMMAESGVKWEEVGQELRGRRTS